MPIDIYDDSDARHDPPGGEARPYVGVLFECCGVYARVYRRPDVPQYEGRCPRCLRELRVRVAADGVNARMLRAR